MGIPDHLTCLLRNLQASQEATVRTGHGTTDWFQIGKGVHKGCILSPCLFNLYAEFSSVQSRPTLCDPMDCNMPGLPAHHQLPEFTQTHPLSQWCHPTISSSVVPFSSCPLSFPASGSFQMTQFFTSGAQSIGVSASASVLPMNIQDWSPSGWTGWISLQSKGLLRVFSSATVQKYQFLGAQLSF